LHTMHDYCARTLAVHYLLEGSDFLGCFQKLREHGVCSQRAWGVCVRSFRAGGYAKDHCYLQGYLRCCEFAETNNIDELFVGKFSIDDLPTVRKLCDAGLLHRPKYLPWFIKDPKPLEEWRARRLEE